MPDILQKDEQQANSRKPRKRLTDYVASSRVVWMDRVAGFVIRSFGVLVILAVFLIFIFVGKEAAPLFFTPTSKAKGDLKLPLPQGSSSMLTWNVDEFQTYSYGMCSDGHFYFISNQDGKVAHDLPVQELIKDQPVQAWNSEAGNYFVVGTVSGKVMVLNVTLKVDYDPSGVQVITPKLKTSALESILPASPPIERVTGSFNAVNDLLSVAILYQNHNLFAGTYSLQSQGFDLKPVSFKVDGKVTGLLIDVDAKYLTASTDANMLYRWNLLNSTEELDEKIKPSAKGSYVTSLNMLLGDFTYILGYQDGSVEAWFTAKDESKQGGVRFQKIREFESHSKPVVGIIGSSVSRAFWTYTPQGELRMHFNPSDRKLYTFDVGGEISSVAQNSHLNGVSVLTRDGRIRQWQLDNPHPDINLKALFSKIWYEGYQEPKHIWQSSSASDNFEAKYGLVPLVIGTMKGAFYGLIFAVPVAVFAALYTSQLMTTKIRTVVKPTIEIMAALPSVVIGFLAGLWIAPFLEKHLLAFLLTGPLFIGLILLVAWRYYQIPLSRRSGIPQEVEVGIMLGVVFLSVILAQMIAWPMESGFFGGNLQQWIYNTLGEKVEQRNSLVIGLAMGFAVIPIIFSISEDAMSNVPRHYVSGSLALGATRWQSAIRVVLPTASPGIFSAIMLGFGRAVGETMIVLMATGNTPILSFSPFNGMRTLSANIAVEIPEAPYAGSLYRVLFLAAILLFMVTFVVNTTAEVIRLRLRQKYRAL